MRTWAAIIAGHLVAVAVLLVIGLHFDNVPNSHPGVTSVFSVAWTIYSAVLVFLYKKNRNFYFFVQRLLLKISRTHTYWQPSFDFDLNPNHLKAPSEILDHLWDLFRKGRHGRADKRGESCNTLSVGLDDLFTIVIRVDERNLHVHLDRKLLVPSHLYDSFRKRFAMLAEDISHAVSPVAVRCGLVVSFGDGIRNPYYGFFVDRVPPDLLQDFQVTFLLSRNSNCRIEATTDRISIEGSSVAELFEAANQVLDLRAVPDGVA
jgi:hypothetical protein